MISRFELCGYFDSNFGDDYMQKITVMNLPEYEFSVPDNCRVSDMLRCENNVIKVKPAEVKFLPKLLVTGSGFMLNSFAAIICELVWLLKKKTETDICIGCNIEPFKSKFAEKLIVRKLRKIGCIICRDKKSFMYLRRKCTKSDVFYTPDILFGLPESLIPEKKSDAKLGLSLMHRYGDKADNAYYRAMAEISDFWIQKTGRDVVLMAFDTGEENDVFACECVKNLMKYKENAEIVCHGSGGEILNAYSACRKIVGARFHSAVLAMKTGTDFFPIIYREKMRNLIEDMKYPVRGCSISDIDTKEIKKFLLANTDFELDKKYEDLVKDSFNILRQYITKEKK